MHFYTYKITNLVNGKIYVGVHKTSNLNDEYMGSGKILKRAIDKHGPYNFHKEILMFHETQEDMFEIEALIVDFDFVKRSDTYNIKIGGFGGWNYINATTTSKIRSERSKINHAHTFKELWKNPEFVDSAKERARKRFISKWQEPEHRSMMLKAMSWAGKRHSLESKEKISKAMKIYQSKERNSQFGKMWIHSLEEKKSTRINKNDLIPDGWIKGRKMFN